MITLTDIIGYVMAHPLLLVGIGILALALIISIIKKIIKAAIVVLVILVVAGGVIYHAASDAVKERGEYLLDEVQEVIGD